MLSKLQESLPEFNVTKHNGFYDASKMQDNGVVLHIPIILNRSTNLIRIAKSTREGWEKANAESC